MTDTDRSLGETIADKIIEEGLATEDEIEDCTEEEIAHIERECDVALPESYKSFLRKLGKSCGDFLPGYDCLYPRMIEQQERAQWVLEREDTTATLGKDDFVFVGSQDVTFFYFNVQNDDPPVYAIAEGHGDPDKHTDTFSDWLWEMIELQT